MRKSELGYYAESYVCEYLLKNGFKIITRNYFTNVGEIDIIAEYDKYICFVEIKYRTNGSGLETAIDRKKQRKIIKSAEHFLRKTGSTLQPRFDAAFVSSYDGGELCLEYISNAFDGSGI